VFTQCPQCETVFRLSADALGAAGGQVRCGRCGEVFDALKRLAEEPRMFAIGESTLELEARAEQILESLGIESRADLESIQTREDGTGNADIEEIAPGIDKSLEFSLTPTDLDRIFIGGVDAGPEVALADAPLPEESQAPDDPQLRDDEYQRNPRRRHDDEYPADDGPVAEELPEDQDTHAPAHAPVTQWDPAALLQPKPLWRWPYVVASILLALLLAAQVVHRNREWLGSRGALGSALRALYAVLGNPLPVPATLSGYQLRQWGASGDAATNGQLRVRASILNGTTLVQPFPLLRVTLEDRFGAHIGTRIFEPAEYSGKTLTRLLSPGERADATVEIQDPGKNAEGFELDVCLRAADGKIRCASDFAPQPP
jgi:predicted Zn finger-like uncharacterized protein